MGSRPEVSRAVAVWCRAHVFRPQSLQAIEEAEDEHKQGHQAPASSLLRRLVLPVAIQDWSLTSLQQRLLKTGGRLIRHARYFTLQLAESYLTGSLFRQMLARMERLAWHPT